MAAWTLPEKLSQWCEACSAVLDRRNRKYFAVLILGMLLSTGRRTVSCWLRAAGVSDDWRLHYYFLGTLGRAARKVATVVLRIAIEQIPAKHVGDYVTIAIDDSPTKRYGPEVELAGIHHNPTPGPAGSEFLYGHVWVTLSWLVRHPRWGCIGLPLWALMYARQKDLEAARQVNEAPWSFRTKLELAAELVEWALPWLKNRFNKRVITVADGAYAKRPFLQRVMKAGGIVVSRLRKDAALYDLPEVVEQRGKGRPRIYGKNRLSLAIRGGHPRGWTTTTLTLYGKEQEVTHKTFLATYPPVGGVIRVVIVKRSADLFRADDDAKWVAYFSTDPEVTAETIIESVADRSAIEQNFHDVKEVHGAGEQQVRDVWANVACWNLCLWLHTFIELWAWNRSGQTLKQRADRPWDQADRRPSHADRVKTARKQAIADTLSQLPRPLRLARKFTGLINHLARLVN